MRNYATQMEAARRGYITPEMETVAKKGIPHSRRNSGAGIQRSGGDLR